MSVRSTSPIMSQSDVQVIPMEEQTRQSPRAWSASKAQGHDPYQRGYDISLADKGNYIFSSDLYLTLL